jgi:branched-chain amino acid transport system substrate-binding protein
VTVGNIGNYSGAAGASLYTGQAMSQVTVKWINGHGGLNGHPISLITTDDSADPSRSLAQAKDMVDNHHAIGFLSNLTEISRAGAEPYLSQIGVPEVGVGGANSLDCRSQNIFNIFPCIDALGAAGATYAVHSGDPKVAIFFCGEADPCRIWRSGWHSPTAAQSGYQNVYETQTSLAQPDFTAECLSAQNHGAQAVALGMDANSVQRASRSCVQQGFHPLFVTASLALTGNLAQDSNVEGISSPIGSFPWMMNDLPGEQDYHRAIQQYAPGLVQGATTSAVWANGMLLKAASAGLPASNPSAADLVKGLYAINHNDFGGLVPAPVTFTRGQPSPGSACYSVVKDVHGTWTSPSASKPLC